MHSVLVLLTVSIVPLRECSSPRTGLSIEPYRQLLKKLNDLWERTKCVYLVLLSRWELHILPLLPRLWNLKTAACNMSIYGIVTFCSSLRTYKVCSFCATTVVSRWRLHFCKLSLSPRATASICPSTLHRTLALLSL